MKLPRFLAKSFEGFDVVDFKEYLKEGFIQIHLNANENHECKCYRCGTKLGTMYGKYRLKLKHLTIFNFKTFVFLWRRKGYCQTCDMVRSEQIDFIASETPHCTAEYSWWLGRLCEIAAVSRAAKVMDEDDRWVWALDFLRLKKMLFVYKIPIPKRISVDEVYARKHDKPSDKSKGDKYFTIISDLDTGKAIWAAESRRMEALEEFFILIGDEGCNQIKVIATDDHSDYGVAIIKYCPNAIHVLDKFHILKNFEEAVNESRKSLLAENYNSDEENILLAGKHRYIFLKRDSSRTKSEQMHVKKLVEKNWRVHSLELIKEAMLMFYNSATKKEALNILRDIRRWIKEASLKPLKKWYENFFWNIKRVFAYFKHRFTTSLSEGINNVIKELKRQGYGYKNMFYFRLKILQRCGYLNSDFISSDFQQVKQI